MVERRVPTLRSVRAWYCSRQIRAEHLKIDNGVEPLEIVVLGRKFLQPLVNIENPFKWGQRITSAWIPRGS
jgi:hypothetical protein